ncbi:MAG: hypothetical protein JSR64_13680, partial [Nitrospira sp.]|nr:hypothetical protein [Nitrospira sp.]
MSRIGATAFLEFLKRLMICADKPAFLIVDGHPIHKATLIKAYVESLNGTPNIATCRCCK